MTHPREVLIWKRADTHTHNQRDAQKMATTTTSSPAHTLMNIAAGTEPADDGEDQLAKAMLDITRTRSEVRKNDNASSALVETVEKAHDTVAQEYLAQHSGAYSVWEEAARKAGRLPEQGAG